MKSGENWSSGFREETNERLQIVYRHTGQGQGQTMPREGELWEGGAKF